MSAFCRRTPHALLLADNRRMLGKLLVVALLMFGFGYALVPMYKAICEALGVNVLSLAEQRREAAATRQLPPTRRSTRTRTVTVEFDANARGPWDFKPAQAHRCRCIPGELATVMYEFRNMQNRTMAAQAIPSYAPKQADGALQQAGVLLLQRVHARAGRIEAVAGGLRHRPASCPRT